MSDVSDQNLKKELYKKCLEERRNRQLHTLKKWDAGRITPRQCIEEILGLEKILFVGSQIIQSRRKQQ